MADIHSKTVRSYNMSKIKSKNTKPELVVRKFLFSHGIRYRLHQNKLAGKPDIVLSKYKTVIFIHGCFWHGHNECAYASLPKTRTEWWKEKIAKNIANDEKAVRYLRETGWRVIVIWSCDLKPKTQEIVLAKLLNELKNC
ncbi:DNA mismatch endonuclease Vsr [Danxiaibacter flavus]|uniref:Very short patch repair endonuclease n=1 Tax=Danxiaibacter flavus TaxID=3049108 RepID=A0ABV3ZM98_9BACT|nr:DNA mismatch endonuclease Vsr [Chitinophagaceae bacterium DXS]